ncbi:choline dehydrogenase [Streptomyces sp. SID5785]|uniref:GMC family oxidoreductase n=1 Tax=Streptomyces sp. SID5785 TaxID=2690309 RepID=UPI0013617F18|nr:GMC family oxidoreductase N-terminal domain-containing protein [Streptomyces sp. SID5785]MZD06716.1 choline dehydrogenase [Streptomyces sp. SID5785]
MSKDRTYDYVIVGAGSAGCVLAGRLSEDPGIRVALVESGPRDRRSEIRIPAAFPKLFRTEYDWDYATSPQPALDSRELYWPRGHTLGGSSSINAMMWVRGHRDDYDTWGETAGEEWGYERFEPFFRRAERWHGPAREDSVHGRLGPLHISPPRDPNPTTAAFLDACRAQGLRELGELNRPDHAGFAITPLNQYRGRRWSAADGYLRPAARRPNLDVYTGARVTRIDFDGVRAAGVVADGIAPGVLRAAREVILAAGAIGSPHLLQQAGIGDPKALADAGIETRVASPEVGGNLQDHLSYAVTVRTPRPVSLTGADTPANIARFLLRGRGPLTSNIGEAVAFVATRPEPTAPDIELVYAPVPFVEHGLTPPAEHGITVGVVLLQPRSRGRITPTGAGAAAPPRIDPGYLADGEDLRTLVAGVRRAEELLADPALRPLRGAPMGGYPGVVDDEALTAAIRAGAETLYHPVGTCRMGADPDAVTDPRLRVRGAESLRVVDASVMPRITRGHTHAPTVALAERAVELIREDARP